jgi:hypothetical protein
MEQHDKLLEDTEPAHVNISTELDAEAIMRLQVFYFNNPFLDTHHKDIEVLG